MRIALLTLGTRGDIQPYAVLGKALKQREHDVTLSTAKNFEALVKSYGIDFLPVEADFEAFLNSDEGKKMMKNPFRARKNLNKWVYPMIYQALTTFYTLAKSSDRVLFHGKTLADQFADQFPEKMIRANVIPAFESTNAFANPVLSGLSLPPMLNKFSYKLTEFGLRMMAQPIRQFREHAGLSVKYKKIELPSIYGISPAYLEKPSDYPASSYFTGFWMDRTSNELQKDIVDFINQGAPPLLVTFGSMPFQSKLNITNCLKRLTKDLNIRIILIRGWGLYNTKDLEDVPAIKVITSAPYDKLFPHVKAVVHHGGIGTIAACLYAGRPFLSCPVLFPLGDQHFWGMIGYKKGVALKPIPLKKLTEDLLISKVGELLTNHTLYENAQLIREKLTKEDSLVNAVNVIEKL